MKWEMGGSLPGMGALVCGGQVAHTQGGEQGWGEGGPTPGMGACCVWVCEWGGHSQLRELR